MPKNDDPVSNSQPTEWLKVCADIEHAADFAVDAAQPKDNGLPYPWCWRPEICRGKGYCPRDPNCGE